MQYGVAEVVNYANWAAQEANAAATELNTLHSYEQEVIQLLASGTRSVSAANRSKQITSLYRDYAIISADIVQMKNAVNPQYFQSQFNSVLATYKQPNWQGVITYGGGQFLPTAGNYQFATANYSAAQTAQQTIASLTAQRQSIQTQRDSAVQSLQTATTQSDVQKWTAIVQALNASMTHIDAEIQQVIEQAKLQQSPEYLGAEHVCGDPERAVSGLDAEWIRARSGIVCASGSDLHAAGEWSNSSGGNNTA